MHNTVRTFVAVEINAEVREQAARLMGRLGRTAAKVKWVEPENLHFTLKFLGEVETLQIPAVCQAVQRATAEVAPFRIEIAGAGAFPNAGRPRTVWIGVGQGQEAMRTLHDRVEKELAPLGFRRERRRFEPHLTIGRVRRSPQGIEELGALVERDADFAAGATDVAEIVVFSSQLDRSGAKYGRLGTAKLLGEA